MQCLNLLEYHNKIHETLSSAIEQPPDSVYRLIFVLETVVHYGATECHESELADCFSLVKSILSGAINAIKADVPHNFQQILSELISELEKENPFTLDDYETFNLGKLWDHKDVNLPQTISDLEYVLSKLPANPHPSVNYQQEAAQRNGARTAIEHLLKRLETLHLVHVDRNNNKWQLELFTEIRLLFADLIKTLNNTDNSIDVLNTIRSRITHQYLAFVVNSDSTKKPIDTFFNSSILPRNLLLHNYQKLVFEISVASKTDCFYQYMMLELKSLFDLHAQAAMIENEPTFFPTLRKMYQEREHKSVFVLCGYSDRVHLYKEVLNSMLRELDLDDGILLEQIKEFSRTTLVQGESQLQEHYVALTTMIEKNHHVIAENMKIYLNDHTRLSKIVTCLTNSPKRACAKGAIDLFFGLWSQLIKTQNDNDTELIKLLFNIMMEFNRSHDVLAAAINALITRA